MRKLLTLATLITLEASSVLAYHGTEATGGSALPIYEAASDNILYLVLPFFAYSFIFNEIMQTYLDRKYSDTTLKSGEDYRDITVAASAVLVFLLMFTRAFHSLGELSISVYAVFMVGLVVAGIALNRRQTLTEFYRLKSRFESE